MYPWSKTDLSGAVITAAVVPSRHTTTASFALVLMMSGVRGPSPSVAVFW